MNGAKHLLIAYSWSFSNIGDIGITPGLLNLIQQQKADLPIQILATQREETEHFALVKDYYRQHYPDYKVHPNHLGDVFSDVWKSFVDRWGPQKIDSFEKGCLPSFESTDIANDIVERLPLEVYEALKQEKPEISGSFADAGFVLYNSGTTLNFGRLGKRNMRSAIRYAMPLLLARALQVPYGINSQSFDALDWPIDLVYRRLFGEARFVYCRDSDSLNYLQQRQLMNRHSGFRPDSTFFFQIFDEAWADRFMQDNGLKNKEFVSVILRLSDNLTNDTTIGGTITAERTRSQMHKIKQVIERWVAETGMKVLLCHETRMTVPAARTYLWDILSEEARKQCVYLDAFWTPEQAYSMIKRTRILLSMEMHSVIMSLNVGTPVIHNPFAEAGRKRQMLRDMGVGDWLVDIDETTGDKMMSVALDIHRDYEKAERRIQDLLPGLKHRANATLSEVWTHWKRD